MFMSGPQTPVLISGTEASALAWLMPPFDSKKIVVATLRCNWAFRIGVGRLLVQSNGVGVGLADDVGRDGDFQLARPKLLEHGGPKRRVFKRRQPQRDQRLAGRLAMFFLVGVRHPQRQHPQDAAGPLEARQALPFPLEDRKHGRVERIGRQERSYARVGVDAGQFLGMFDGPFGSRPTPSCGLRRQSRATRTTGGG